MKQMLLTFVISTLVLLGFAYASDVIIITINQPQNTTILNNSFNLNASMNLIGNMKYSVNNGTNVTACENCSDFNVGLTLPDGSHNIIVYGSNSSIENSSIVYFSINTSLTTTTTTIPTTTTTVITTTTVAPTTTVPNTTTTIPSKYTLGFQKLPQLYKSGNITNTELINILNNNTLNPGVLNRLIKTGKLPLEVITIILKTQNMPVGILNKILWYFGYGHNHLVEDLFNQYNITDEQFGLILKQEIPPGTMKHIISSKSLTEQQINLLLNKELKPGIIEKLVEDQTLSNETIEKIFTTQKMPNGLMKKLIENQQLSENNIETVVNKTDNPKILDDLLKNQKPTDEQEEKIRENLPKGLNKKYNVTLNTTNIPSINSVGKQEGHREKENKTQTTMKPEKEQEFKDKPKEQIENTNQNRENSHESPKNPNKEKGNKD